jgi:hypothetical protein
VQLTISLLNSLQKSRRLQGVANGQTVIFTRSKKIIQKSSRFFRRAVGVFQIRTRVEQSLDFLPADEFLS